MSFGSNNEEDQKMIGMNNGNNNHEEEQKRNESSEPLPEEHMQMVVEDEGLACNNCKKGFKDEQMADIMMLEKCAHFVCKECLKEMIKVSYPAAKCPCDDCD